jgi:kynurenine formamidase
LKITFALHGQDFSADLSKPIDISLPLSADARNPIAWYLEKPVIAPVRFSDWTGKVSEGASTNFNNIAFNPHGHGTHTECLGHITHGFYSVNQTLKQFFFDAELISVRPERHGEDQVITRAHLEEKLRGKSPEAAVIRTLPNETAKRSRHYSNTNPPYMLKEAAQFLREIGVYHLLIDLPSVDREHDDGKLLAHKAFWNVADIQNLNPDARPDATITELVFVPDFIHDGRFLLNLQTAPFENDAAPSRPVLFALHAL